MNSKIFSGQFLLWLGVLVFLSSCGKFSLTKKKYVHENYYAKIVTRYFYDTTFVYDHLDPFSSLNLSGIGLEINLPDSIGWNHLIGDIHVYAIVSAKGEIMDIEVIEFVLLDFKKKKHVCYCSNSISNRACKISKLRKLKGFEDFHTYILNKLKVLPLNQKAEATKDIHYAYCMFDFGEIEIHP